MIRTDEEEDAIANFLKRLQGKAGGLVDLATGTRRTKVLNLRRITSKNYRRSCKYLERLQNKERKCRCSGVIKEDLGYCWAKKQAERRED